MNELNVKGVFFDFDDTLQSRKAAYKLYCERFLDKYFPGDDREERRNKLYEMEALVDGGYKDREVYFPELIRLWGWRNHPSVSELADDFNFEYGKQVVMLRGAVETLRELKRRGYILGMISNGNSTLQNMKLDTAGIRELFDVCIVSDDFGVAKPNAAIFFEALDQVGLTPEEAVYIGDHPKNDIDGALNAGMHVIRMNYGDFAGKGLSKPVAATITAVPQALEFLPGRSNAKKAVKKNASKSHAAAQVQNKPIGKKQKKSAFAVKTVALICAALIAGLAILSSFTDIFSTDSGDKLIFLSSLKAEQKESFNAFASKYIPLFERGFNADSMNFDDLLELLKPGSSGGLLATALGITEPSFGETDPAERFGSSNYIKLSKDDMQLLADSIGIQMLTNENSRSVYYYDNNFYLALDSSAQTDPVYTAVLNTSETGEGDYYVTLGAYSSESAANEAEDGAELYKRYALASLNSFGGSDRWTLKEVSESPLYSKNGARLETEDDSGKLSYTFERKTMNATTSDGVNFAVYYIEYPQFDEDGIAQAACESVYSDKVEEFRTRVANADSFYEAYKDAGGRDEDLPLTVDEVVSISFNRSGYISLVDRTSTYDPTPEVKEEESTTESRYRSSYYSSEEETTEPQVEEKRVILPTVQYVGYTFEIDSGSFVKKDELTGDFNSFSAKLASIYSGFATAVQPQIEQNVYEQSTTSGYGYNESTTSAYGYGESATSAYGYTQNTTSAYSSSNGDSSNSVGAEIYNSSWAISENGMDFYFIPDDGLLSKVTVPWNELAKQL